MSDASAGQIVGGVAGAVVGFVATGFNPVGAVQGFAVGYGIGGYVDPPDGPLITAPKLSDLSFQSSTYGAPLPTVEGTIGISGNVIYLENGKYKQVVTQNEQDGKGGGGGATVESVEYFATFAVSLCEAKAGAKIGKIWLGGKLVYNVSPSTTDGQSAQSTVYQSSLNVDGWSFYDGTQTEPDDRIESVVGVDNAESYEGTAYIVIKDLSLSLYGNSLTGCPVKVELVTEPVYIAELLTSTSVDHDAPINSFNPTPNTLTVARSLVSVPHWNATYLTPSGFDSAERDFSGFTKYETSEVDIGIGEVPPYGLNDTFTRYKSNIEVVPGKNVGLYQTRSKITAFIALAGEHGVSDQDGFVQVLTDTNVRGCCVTEGGTVIFITTTDIKEYSTGMALLKSISHNIPQTGTSLGQMLMWNDNGTLYIGEDEGPRKFYAYDDSLSGDFRVFTVSPMVSDAPLTSQIIVDNGVMVRSWADDNKVYFDTWSVVNLAPSPANLEGIVDRIAARCGIGLESIDATALSTTSVDGYAMLPSDGRGALSPLQGAFLFDVIPTGYKLTARLRQTVPVVTIPYGDLGASKVGGATSDRLSRTREMDSQLPSRLNISYYDKLREYDTSVQYAENPTQTENIKSVEFPIVMSAGFSAKLADVLIRLSWIERDLFKFSVPQKYLNLVVSDVVTVETPERDYLIRIQSINDSRDQIRDVVGRLSAPALYESTAQGSEGVLPDESIDITSESFSSLIDSPMITESADSAGYGLAMYGAGNWPGGSLFRSLDDGLTYSNAQTLLNKTTVGVCTDVIGYSDGFVIDRLSRLTVNPESALFEGITEAQMLRGQNWAAYGDDGRWELIRYSGAALNADGTITLSTLIRSARGTEAQSGLHEVGDKVVIIDSGDIGLVASSLERLNVSGTFKSVTIGLKANNATPFNFTYRGVNLKPLSPVLPDAEINGSGDWLVSCRTRTRYASSFWLTGIQPQNESVLAYELDVLDGGAIVRTISSGTASFNYTASEQTDDFGGTVDMLDVLIYQVSERVGRGTPLSASFDYSNILDFDNPALTAAYTMDNVSGATLLDESGNSIDGATSGVAYVAGYIANAASFQQANDKIDFSSRMLNSVGSVSFFIKLNSITSGASQVVFDQRDSGNLSDGLIQYLTDGSLLFIVSGGSSVTSSAGIATTEWQHVTVTRDESEVRFYFDGVLDSSQSFSGGNAGTITKATMGQRPSDSPSFNPAPLFGLLDQVRFFNKVLTQAEITDLANET